MSETDIGERLREAREARGENLAALAKRIGVRQEHLRAIETGRFGDLPPGIYGRAAIKSYARAFGFDPGETLAACESLLQPIEEPISALGRLRGIRQPKPEAAPAATSGSRRAPALRTAFFIPPSASPSLNWRVLAAAAVDACVVVALLLAVILCAATALTVPLAAFAHSAPSFGVMGLVLAVAYFVWFGGLAGATVGERVLRVQSRGEPALLTLRAIGARALQAATEDARFIQRVGIWLGAFTVQGRPLNDDDLTAIEQHASR